MCACCGCARVGALRARADDYAAQFEAANEGRFIPVPDSGLGNGNGWSALAAAGSRRQLEQHLGPGSPAELQGSGAAANRSRGEEGAGGGGDGVRGGRGASSSEENGEEEEEEDDDDDDESEEIRPEIGPVSAAASGQPKPKPPPRRITGAAARYVV